ncbi:MAG TPA: hypothetical protein VJ696_13565 [Rhodanobacteraceae bacterium]|nr:hypothetical protein [Rhodanobacteraceae bacterium]
MQPTVIHAARHDVSAPMRDIVRNMPPQQPRGEEEEEAYPIPNILLKLTGTESRHYTKGLQNSPTGVPAPPVDLSFEAISSATSQCGCLPPDTNGDVSDQHYIQWVNSRWAVYDKTDGTEVQPPTDGSSFWVGFGGPCENTNAGDPIALWDTRAQRWVMSQFVVAAQGAQCVAISTSPDPLGTYNRYQFNFPRFGDYPKLATWTDGSGSQDAYLLTTHEFTNPNNGSFTGAALIALERDKMLAGDPSAAMIRFPGLDAYGVEPVNLAGTLDAPANACPSFVHYDATNNDGYLFWDLCLNWTTPASSVLSSPTHIAGHPFTPYGFEVPQQGTASGLDSFGTHVMYRANARAFPDGAPTKISLVINHVVLGDVDQGGVNWVHFNLDDHGANPPTPTALDKTLLDEGVYAPDGETRWMGGVAMDQSGNIGLGFSKSSADSHPQIEITGRTYGDVPGTMRDESNCTDGIANGSQTSTSQRWGDYSSMSVDPVDQCTFYFTSEYYPTMSGGSWHTRVCSFKFDNCGQPDFAIVGESPRRVEMCAATTPTDPTYAMRLGVLNGFTGSANLSVADAPAGVTPTFSVNPVTLPGSSTLTLTNATGLPSGEYSMSVDAVSGAVTHSFPIELGLSATAPGAPELMAPADAAAEVFVYPTLTWGEGGNDSIFADGFDGGPTAPAGTSGGALSYTVEVATDAAFTDIVASATVTTTSWTVDTLLDPTTTYYWRVTPHNYCGDGTVSQTFSFTTGVPGVCPSGTTATTVFQDDFQNGTNGWTVAGTGDVQWAQGAAPAGTGMSTTTWLIPNNDTTSDRLLTSPAIAIPAGAAAVFASYDAYHKSEQNGANGCFDESSLETSTDNTTFSYLDTTHLLTDPYNGFGANDSAIGNRKGWCYTGSGGDSAPTHSIVDLGSFAGQSVNFRVRMTTDSNTTAAAPNGFVMDNFKVEVCQ